MVQMEHAIIVGSEVDLELELFELALQSWKEFLEKGLMCSSLKTFR